jgi:hypothetical protein
MCTTRFLILIAARSSHLRQLLQRNRKFRRSIAYLVPVVPLDRQAHRCNPLLDTDTHRLIRRLTSFAQCTLGIVDNAICGIARRDQVTTLPILFGVLIRLCDHPLNLIL